MATLEVTEFVTIEGLVLCETGIDYPASTGPVSLTTSMFASAVEFTQDPHGLSPRIKISHGANPINEDLQSLFDAYNANRDGSEPALGTILNLRTENSGHTLTGDWFGLPRWFADILQSAYPARSIEGGSWQNPANQKTYDFIIEACVLLGVVGPGCTSLADVQELFSADGPTVTVIEMSKKPTKMGGTLRMPAQMQVNVEDIRRSFYNEFAQGERYWWWDRELLSDPWEFICSDDNGDLWRVPFEVEQDDAGDTVVTAWGDPQPIKIQYTPDTKRDGEQVAAVRMVSSLIPGTGTVLAVNNTKPTNRRQKEAKPAMAIDVPALRTRLGISEEDLPDDATEEQINAALAAEPSEETETTETETEAGAPAVAASANSNVIQVDREVWEQTRLGAAAGMELQRERDRESNQQFLETAIREGRITRASRDSYLTQMNGSDNTGRGPARDSIKAMIEGLPKGVSMPTTEEIGHGEGEPTTTDTQMGTGLFPKLEEARAARAAGREN